MPSETFFRLPEEKRQRLMDAAWSEFTTVRFSDASINKIIRAAGIPRGSFYQYFTDKDDLFAHLVRPIQLYFFDLARQEVEAANGDLSRAPTAIYDRFFDGGCQHSLDLKRCIQVIRCNPDSEFHNLFCSPESPLVPLFELVDTQTLNNRNPAYIREVFGLFIFILASSIIDTLNHPERQAQIRTQLVLRVEILLRGCMAPAAHTHEGGPL